MSATVETAGRPTRTVKNLGWLYRHRGDVISLTFWRNSAGGGELVASLLGARTYRTDFQSESVFRDWAGRRMRDVPVYDH